MVVLMDAPDTRCGPQPILSFAIRQGRPRSLGDTPRAPGVTKMARKGWATIAIPDDLHAQDRRKHVLGHGRFVQGYVQFWVQIGLLIDRVFEGAPDHEGILRRVLQGLKALELAAWER